MTSIWFYFKFDNNFWTLLYAVYSLSQKRNYWNFVILNVVRAEIGEFVEYDLDNEDEDWLQDVNRERKALAAEK